MFEILGLSKEQVQEKFGFFLEAQELGFPPHGGIALGLDRLIMLMTFTINSRSNSISKNTRGYDLMMEAPTHVEEKQLHEYGIKLLPKARDKE